MKKFLTAITTFLLIFTFTGCTKQETFEHKIMTITPEATKNTYKFEVEVNDVTINYYGYSKGLDATIKITAMPIYSYIDIGVNINYKSFDFYINYPITINKTYMYIDDKDTEIKDITLQPYETEYLHLQINYRVNNLNNEILDNYVIKFCDVRI